MGYVFYVYVCIGWRVCIVINWYVWNGEEECQFSYGNNCKGGLVVISVGWFGFVCG